MKPRIKPSSGSSVVVGKKPLWELWVESQQKQFHRGAELLAKGAFTARDMMKKTGWSNDRCRGQLANMGLKYELANDEREYQNPRVRFYFPPGVNP